VIILALLLLGHSSKFPIKLIVVTIVLCNIGLLGLCCWDNTEEHYADYNDILAKIQKFKLDSSALTEETQQELSNKNAEAINTKLAKLNEQIDGLAHQLNTAIGTEKEFKTSTVNFETSDKILYDIEVYKQLQLAKLSDLKNQLAKTQQIVNAQTNIADSNKYKPIKIYSSCTISNADGSMSSMPTAVAAS
jgi:uncharacterized membrane protein YgaE (UPF0421/DUF939 family)